MTELAGKVAIVTMRRIERKGARLLMLRFADAPPDEASELLRRRSVEKPGGAALREQIKVEQKGRLPAGGNVWPECAHYRRQFRECSAGRDRLPRALATVSG
jgi:hypothetical protein